MNKWLDTGNFYIERHYKSCRVTISDVDSYVINIHKADVTLRVVFRYKTLKSAKTAAHRIVCDLNLE